MATPSPSPQPAQLKTLSHGMYTVAWISPLPVEQIAAITMLDEVHEPLWQSPRDSNVYKLGRIHRHNIVIAGLHSAGNTSAATVVGQLMITFPNILFGLLVGIGGGVPCKTGSGWIKLGDIIVGKPTGVDSGTIQYDHGKALATGVFQRMGSLAPPPPVLLNAAQALEIHRKMANDDPILTNLARIQVNQHCVRHFAHPGTANDRLYQPEYIHLQPDRACKDCGCKESQRIVRPQDGDDDPDDEGKIHDNGHCVVIHAGTIASGGQVIRDAILRDKLAKQYNVICFEMEAAGASSSFPCMVIRGVSDYCDSHKNDQWHGFAAAIAAAYARQLFFHMPFSPEAENINVSNITEPATTGPSKELIGPISAGAGDSHCEHGDDINEETIWRALFDRKRFKEAEEIAREVRRTRLLSLGPNHSLTLDSQNWLGLSCYWQNNDDDAYFYFRRTATRFSQKRAEQYHAILFALYWCGRILCKQGKFEEAEIDLKRVAEAEEGAFRTQARSHLGRSPCNQSDFTKCDQIDRGMGEFGGIQEVIFGARCLLGIVLRKRKTYGESAFVLRNSLEKCQKRFGKNGIITLDTLHALGITLWRMGRTEKAEEALVEAVSGRSATLGELDGDTLDSLHHLGLVFGRLSRYEEAETTLRKAASGRLALLGPNHQLTLESALKLGMALKAQGRHRDASEELRRVADACQESNDAANRRCARFALAQSLWELKEYEEAEEILRELEEQWKWLSGKKHHNTVLTTYWLGWTLMRQQKYAEAERVFREAVDISKMTLGERGERGELTLEYMYSLSYALLKQDGASEEARKIAKVVLALRKHTLGRTHADTIYALKLTGQIAYGQNKLEEAGKILWEAVNIGTNLLEMGDQEILEALDLYGRALYKQNLFEKAEQAFLRLAQERKWHSGAHDKLTVHAEWRHGKARDRVWRSYV